MSWIVGEQMFQNSKQYPVHYIELHRLIHGRYASCIGQQSGDGTNLHNTPHFYYMHQTDPNHIWAYGYSTEFNAPPGEIIPSTSEVVLWGYDTALTQSPGTEIPDAHIVKRIKIYASIQANIETNINVSIGFSDRVDSSLGNIQWGSPVSAPILDTESLVIANSYGTIFNVNSYIADYTDTPAQSDGTWDNLNYYLDETSVTFPHPFDIRKLRIKFNGFDNEGVDNITFNHAGIDIYSELDTSVKMKVSSGKVNINNGKVEIR